MQTFDNLASLPVLANVKDFHSTFISLSDVLAKMLGWKTAENALGHTDYDIPCGKSEFASEFIRFDQMVIKTGVKMVALDIQHYAIGWRLILAEKNPIKNEVGEVTAIFSNCIDVSDVPLFKTYLYLNEADNKYTGKNMKPASYILTAEHSPFNLTSKQESCLFLLIRGKSIKEIGKYLNISPRTVEDHLSATKEKLKCHNKSDLIEKALINGYLYYVPKTFQHNLLDNNI